MKLPIIISVIFFLIIGFAVNVYFLKLSTLPFIGIMLIALLILGIVGNFFNKVSKRRKGIRGEPDAFIFPDKVAKGMKKMNIGIQYEASVISSALLILGIILFLIYYIFFTQSSWVMKGLIIFNSICGIGLMGGMLVTYYHQLLAYRESTKFLHQYAASPKNKILNKTQQEDLYPQESQEPYEEGYENGDYYEPYDYKMKGGIEKFALSLPAYIKSKAPTLGGL